MGRSGHAGNYNPIVLGESIRIRNDLSEFLHRNALLAPQVSNLIQVLQFLLTHNPQSTFSSLDAGRRQTIHLVSIRSLCSPGPALAYLLVYILESLRMCECLPETRSYFKH